MLRLLAGYLFLFILVALLGNLVSLRVIAQQEGPVIMAPQPGQALQGVVNITGISAVNGFVSAEIAFAYASNPTDTWFLIAASTQPVIDGTLAVWDTAAITDGMYSLRLRVTLSDGTFLDEIVPDLRVRNYTPVETNTPTITPTVTPTGEPTATPLPTATATATPYPTPTPLPPNPAALIPRNIYASLSYGALSVAVVFALFVLYLRLRRH